jgi:hypothetical protein
MGEQFYYQNHSQALRDIRNTYVLQLDEVEKERAEIATGKEEIRTSNPCLLKNMKDSRVKETHLHGIRITCHQEL